MKIQENNITKGAKRHEKIGLIIFVCFFSILSIGLIVMALLNSLHEATKQSTPEIAITSNITKSYYNGSDSIVAVLCYQDGSIDDNHVFTYTSDHPSVLRFETSTRGEFIVIDKDYRGEVGIDIKSSIEGVTPAHTSIEIVSPPDYSITLDYNGASCDSDDKIAVWAGEILGDALPQPSLENYEFQGWYPILTDGSMDVKNAFNPRDRYFWGRDLTLRARFKSSLKLDDDMGGVTVLQESDTTSVDVFYNEPLVIDLPKLGTKNGWQFDGWYSEIGGDGTAYCNAGEIFHEDEPHLYAKWVSGGIELDSIFEGGIPTEYDVTYHALPSLPIPLYENGGIFVGWYTEIEGAERIVSNEERFNYSADTHMYAKIKFPIEFDYKGATPKEGQYFALYNGSMSSMNWELPIPTMLKENGWQFEGWYLAADSEFDENTICTQPGVVHLYAKRTSNIKLYRELDSEGKINSALFEEYPVVYDEPLMLPNNLTAGAWAFAGFYALEGGKGDQVLSTDHYTDAGERKLYAKWDTVIDFHVSLDLLGNAPKPVSVTFKSEIPTLPTPIYKDGGEFAGWFTSEFGQGTPIDVGEPFIYEPELKVFDKVEFTISVDYQDASSKNGGSDTYTAVYGRSLNDIGIKVPDPIKNNWEFAGWYTNPLNEDKVLDSTAYTFTSPITVFARWTRNITLDTGISELANETLQATYGRKLTLPRNAGDDAYWGTWRFDGWYTQRLGQETKIENQEAYFDEEYTTLYANWVLDQVTLIFNNADKTDTLEGIIYGQTIFESTGKKLPQSPEETGTRDGYYYATGWHNQNNDDAILVDNNTRKYPQVMSALYLRWEPKEYTITLDPNGGIQSGGTSVKVKMEDRLPDHIAPTRDGIDFEGYYTIDGRGPYYTRGADNQMLGTYWDIPDDTTLIAKWETTYEISLLNFEGGIFQILHVALNKKLPNISAPTAPKGYSFGGYYAESDFNGQPYYDMNMSSVRIWDRNIETTLYPKPVAIPITVSPSSTNVGEISKSKTVTINVSGGSGQYLYEVIGEHPGISTSLPSNGNILTLTKSSSNQGGTVTVQVTDEINGERATCSISYSTDGCLAEGTLITLADGSQKAIEDLVTGEMVMSWNFFTGEKCAVPVIALWYHGTYKTEVVTLNFENGTSVRMVATHGFFDYTLNEFVFISSENYMSYIGDEFVCDDSTNYATTKLKSAEVSIEEIGVYSILTAYNYNAYAEGMLSLTPSEYVGLWASFFDMSSDMKFDKDAMQADIEKYGLFTYSEWSDYVTEQEFEAFGGAYFKVLIGKGVITYEQLYELLDGFRSNPEIQGNASII